MNSSISAAFVIAMDNEAEAVLAHLEDCIHSVECGRKVVCGKLADEKVMVVISGIGKVNAAAATQFAISEGAPLIVNVGVAGGLGDRLKIADVCEVSSAVQYDFDLAKINGTEIGVLNERNSPFIPVEPVGLFPSAILATGDRFNDNPLDLGLLRHLKATLRDMEGGAIAHVCERSGIPCRMVKCISDVIDSEESEQNATDQYLANLKKCLAVLSETIERNAQKLVATPQNV